MNSPQVKPRICVLRAPGTNCDIETAYAFEMAGGIAERVHLFRLLESPELLGSWQILCIPGGFSYGDDIGAGVIFSRHLKRRLKEELTRFLSQGKLVLGICNGFQVLLKSGLLPEGSAQWHFPADPKATLTWNDNGQYTARWVRLKAGKTHNVFLQGVESIELPIAHAEGKFVVRDKNSLSQWDLQGQVALRYTSELNSNDDENYPLDYPHNPNGSLWNIAGLSDPEGQILGLMPHPERFIFRTQHPQWTRHASDQQYGDGLKLFQNGVNYFA